MIRYKYLVVVYFKEVDDTKHYYFQTEKEVNDFKETIELGNSQKNKKLTAEIIATYKIEKI